VGALSSAFVPVFTKLIVDKKHHDANTLASGILFFIVLVLSVSAIALSILAPLLVPLLVPGFDSVAVAKTVHFTRILFLSSIFLGVSAVWSGILMSHKRFFVYSLAPIFYNIGIIVGALWLVPIMGEDGLIWGVVLGSFTHMLIQVPSVRKTGFSYIFVTLKALRDTNVRRVLVLMLPRLFSSASSQMSFIVITIFASTLIPGSIAAFTLANNIQSVVLGLVGVPFSIAVFPTLSSLFANNKTDEFVRVLAKTMRRILYFVIPFSVLVILLRAQIVRVLLGAGEFDWEDTTMTFTIMGILAASLFAQAMILLLVRAFSAMQETKLPFYCALAAQILNVLCVLFVIDTSDTYAIYGIAWSFSFSMVVNMILLLVFLHVRLKTLNAHSIAWSLVKITTASFVMAVVIQFGKEIVGAQAKIDTFLEVFAQLLGAGCIGIATYLLLSAVLKIEEFRVLKKDVLTKVFRRPAVAKEVATEESHQENI
jgi:putative peptidoglycan lipid II flippase